MTVAQWLRVPHERCTVDGESSYGASQRPRVLHTSDELMPRS